MGLLREGLAVHADLKLVASRQVDSQGVGQTSEKMIFVDFGVPFQRDATAYGSDFWPKVSAFDQVSAEVGRGSFASGRKFKVEVDGKGLVGETVKDLRGLLLVVGLHDVEILDVSERLVVPSTVGDS